MSFEPGASLWDVRTFCFLKKLVAVCSYTDTHIVLKPERESFLQTDSSTSQIPKKSWGKKSRETWFSSDLAVTSQVVYPVSGHVKLSSPARQCSFGFKKRVPVERCCVCLNVFVFRNGRKDGLHFLSKFHQLQKKHRSAVKCLAFTSKTESHVAHLHCGHPELSTPWRSEGRLHTRRTENLVRVHAGPATLRSQAPPPCPRHPKHTGRYGCASRVVILDSKWRI